MEDFLKLEKEGSALKDHMNQCLNPLILMQMVKLIVNCCMLFKNVINEQQDVEDYILMQASPRFVSDDKRELFTKARIKCYLKYGMMMKVGN